MSQKTINPKSEIRKKLEKIESSIKLSWYKDLDKTADMEEFINIQKDILNSDSIEAYFNNNQDDIDYFKTQFTQEIISKLRIQSTVQGDNGDELALEIFTNYLLFYLKFHKDQKNIIFWDSIRSILDQDCMYYQGNQSIISQRFQYQKEENSLKAYKKEQFNELFLTKKSCLHFKKDDECDILIDYKESRNNYDSKCWIRSKIKNIDSNFYYATSDITQCEYKINIYNNISQILPVGFATKDWNDRLNFKVYDVIDCYDRCRWYPGTILEIGYANNNIKCPYYNIGFRLYLEHCPDYEKYANYYNSKNTVKADKRGNYIGDGENMDEPIAFYSKRIQKRGTFIEEDGVQYSAYANGEGYYGVNLSDSEGEEFYNFADRLFEYKEVIKAKKVTKKMDEDKGKNEEIEEGKEGGQGKKKEKEDGEEGKKDEKEDGEEGKEVNADDKAKEDGKNKELLTTSSKEDQIKKDESKELKEDNNLQKEENEAVDSIQNKEGKNESEESTQIKEQTQVDPTNIKELKNNENIDNTEITKEVTHNDQQDQENKEKTDNDYIIIKKNYIIGKSKNFFYYYALLLKGFADKDGFEEIINILEDNPTSDDIFNILFFLQCAMPYLHNEYLIEKEEKINTAINNFINKLTPLEMRNTKKELIDSIIRILNQISEISSSYPSLSSSQNDESLDIILNLSFKMIKTSIFDKRLQGIKTISDYILQNSCNDEKLKLIIKYIKENNLINEIFGTNSHSQFISKSKEIIELLLKTNELSKDDLLLIISKINKIDMESKRTIINLLLEVIIYFDNANINIILDYFINTYNSNNYNDIMEIELLQNLILKIDDDSFSSELDKNIETIIINITQCLLSLPSITDEKIDKILDKIISITNKYPKFINNIFTICIDSIKEKKHCLLSYKILEKYLYNFLYMSGSDELIIEDNPYLKIINNNYLLNIYVENFKSYKETISQMISSNKSEQGNNININLNEILVDGFNHFDNVTHRLSFLKLLIQLYSDINFVDFLVDILINNPICEIRSNSTNNINDTDTFFIFLNTIISESNIIRNKNIQNDLFNLFINNKIIKSITTNYYLSFKIFIQVFFYKNQIDNKLIITNTSTNDIFPDYILIIDDVDNLSGFDILWKISFESESKEITDNSLNVIYKLYMKNKNIDKLLIKCKQLIMDESESKEENSKTVNIYQIEKCFKLLILIFTKSEMNILTNIKTHDNLNKEREYEIKILYNEGSHFIVNVFANTTMDELKQILATKIKKNINSISLSSNKIDKLILKSDKINIKTISELGIKDKDYLMLNISKKNKNEDLMYLLIKNDKPTPKFEKIISQIFLIYSDDWKMSKADCLKFLNKVNLINLYNFNETKLKNMFAKYDKNKKGYLDLNDFTNYYKELAKKEISTLWNHLSKFEFSKDLKTSDEPITFEVFDKQKLPRYQLGNDIKFINYLFDFYNKLKDNKNTKELLVLVYSFLFNLTTNEELYNQFINEKQEIEENKEKENKESLFMTNNLIKDLYFLKIIQSIIEDIELISDDEKDNDNSFILYEPFDSLNNEIRNKEKINWMVYFIKNHYSQLIDYLIQLINNNINEWCLDGKNNLLNDCINNCVSFITVLFNCSLYKFNLSPANINSNSIISNAYNSDEIKHDKLQEIFIIEKLSDIIMNTVNYYNLSNKLINYLLVNINANEIGENVYLSLELLIYILTFIIDNDDFKNLFSLSNENMTKDKENLIKLFEISFTSKNINYLSFFIDLLRQSTKLAMDIKNYDQVLFYLNVSFNFFLNIFKDNSNNKSNENIYNSFNRFIDFFIFLYDLIYSFCSTNDTLKHKFIEFNTKIEDLVYKILQIIYNELINEYEEPASTEPSPDKASNIENLENQNSISINLLIGFIRFLIEAIEFSAPLKSSLLYYKINNNVIYDLLLSKIFIGTADEKNKENNSSNSSPAKKINKILSEYKEKFIPISNLKVSSSKFTNPILRKKIQDLIISLSKSSPSLTSLFFSTTDEINIQEAALEQIMKNKKEESSDASCMELNYRLYYMNYYKNSTSQPKSSVIESQPKKEGHVGLKNLGCICYMNSIMQQIYMVPTFRYAIMQSDDKKPSTVIETNQNRKKSSSSDKTSNIDDNILHQLQKMYTYLYFSEKQDYNPKEFCFSYKDFDGNPINEYSQQDSQEFLTGFFDKIEEGLKGTVFQYIVSNVFVGRTCSQVICNNCKYASYKFEDFYNLNLEVLNINNLNESLNKFVCPEQIDEFNCEKCNKKVTITKRNSLADLPNVLIIYLKRFIMDYETGSTQKINSKLEFPQSLNLKEFCIEDIMSKDKNKDSNINSDIIYYKNDSYYQYQLKGVNVHIGSAEGGHYFSFINVNRDGINNHLINNTCSEEDSVDNNWLKFNDSSISKFNINNLSEECFGGNLEKVNGYNYENYQNAYLLVYERVNKVPIKELLNEKNNLTNIDKQEVIINDDNRDRFNKLFNISQYSFDNEAINGDTKINDDKTIKEKLTIDSVINNKEIDLNTIPKDFLISNIKNTLFYDKTKDQRFKYIDFYDIKKEVNVDYYKEVSNENEIFIKSQNKDESLNNFYENIIKELDKYYTMLDDKEKNNLFDKENKLKILVILLDKTIKKIQLLNNSDTNNYTKESSFNLAKKMMKFIYHLIKNDDDSIKYFVEYMNKKYFLVFNLPDSNVEIIKIFKDIIEYIIKYYTSQKEYQKNVESIYTNIFALYKKDRNKIYLLNNILLLIVDNSLKSNISNEEKDSNKEEMNVIEYLLNNNYLYYFVKFIISKENEYMSKATNAQWIASQKNSKISDVDISRNYRSKFISDFKSLSDVIYILFNANPFYKNKQIRQKDKYEYRKESAQTNIPNEESYSNLNELEYIKSFNFLKLLYNLNFEMFLDIITMFEYNNIEFTNEAIEQISSFYHQIKEEENTEEANNKVNIYKLNIALYEMLKIKDKLQFHRFTILIGYPTLIINCKNKKSNNHGWPSLGYTLVSGENDEYIKYNSLNKSEENDEFILKQLTSVKDDIAEFNEFHYNLFIQLLRNISFNYAMFKYIYLMPCRSLKYENLYMEIYSKTLKLINCNKEEKNKEEFLAEVNEIHNRCKEFMTKVNEELENNIKINNESKDFDFNKIPEDDEINLKYFNGFINNYIPKFIVKEKISQVCIGEDLMVLRISYYTTIQKIKEEKEIIFNEPEEEDIKRYQKEGVDENIESEKDKDKDKESDKDKEKDKEENKEKEKEKEENKNKSKVNSNKFLFATPIIINTNTNEEIYEVDDARNFDEKLFINQVSQKVHKSNNSIIIINKQLENIPSYLTYVRYVIMNFTKKSGNLNIDIKKVNKKINIDKNCNYFWPTKTSCYIKGNNYIDVLTIYKFKYQEPIFNENDIGLDIRIDFENYSNYNNYNFNKYDVL